MVTYFYLWARLKKKNFFNNLTNLPSPEEKGRVKSSLCISLRHMSTPIGKWCFTDRNTYSMQLETLEIL